MKLTLLSIFFVLVLSIAATAQTAKPSPTPTPAPSPAATADISGKWSLAADAGGQTLSILVELKQTGADFSGTTTSDLGNGKIDSGKVTGKAFTAVLHADVQGQAIDFKMEGTLDGDKMSGSFSNAGFGSVPFSATRTK